jgi:phosphoribosyl 1,2-cyclic phosphate phosphodiesterase
MRTRAAYNLGDDVRIDFGPDSHLHMRAAGRDYSSLEHLLVTHSHDDHWFPKDLDYRRPGFCVLPEDAPPLTVYGNAQVMEAARASLKDPVASRIELREIRAFETFEAGRSLTVTTVRAEHAGDEEAVNFILREPGRTVLIAHDTGYWEEESWAFVAGIEIDVALIDSTYGRYDQNGGHMGAPWVVKFAGRLRELGCLGDAARVIATHFSHNGHANHGELVDIYNPHGIQVAYDGMILE